MKKMSITGRVSLWYAFSFMAFLILATGLLLAAGNRLVIGERTSNLQMVTDRAVKDVWVIDGKLSIDDDISYYSDGAYVVLYRDDGTLISGLIPEGFSGLPPFEADTLRKIQSGKDKYYVYDRLIENEKMGRIWIRGMTSANLEQMMPSVMRMVYGFLIAIPLLFAIALAGGWLITKQAFAPLNQIVETARRIRTGGDLSERIELEDEDDPDEIGRTALEFDKMLDQIEKDFEMEKQFTNDASHQLRTPIAVILAQSEYALDSLDNPEEVRESLQMIRDRASHMSSLVSQLLLIARADRRIDQLVKKRTDISLLAEEAAESFRREAESRQIRICINAAEGCYMDCDPLFMGQMFNNLIDNSLKYGRPGGTTGIRIWQEEDMIRIRIRDDGIGISEEDLPRVFERFYRGSQDHADGNPEEGAGLGLPIAKWIVEAHQGIISVESKPGEGTVFQIWFPA